LLDGSFRFADDMNTHDVRLYLLGLQDRIIGAMEAEGGEPFITDSWTRPPGERLQGDGLSRLIEGGQLLERGGCNFSHVKGAAMPPSATQHRPELAGAPFEAMGVSLVIHPRNPYARAGGVVRWWHGPHAVLRL
jgi:coproporphyrinogen III oxidase